VDEVSDGVQVPYTCAYAGATTDWISGAAHTVAAPTTPARLSNSRRFIPASTARDSWTRSDPDPASFLAQSSNRFVTSYLSRIRPDVLSRPHGIGCPAPQG
jgi:hypothetical protein